MSQAGVLNISDGDLPGDVPLVFIGNSGSGSAVAHDFYILGTGGVTTSVSGDVLTISASVSSFSWNVVTSASPTNPIQIVAANGYSCQGSSLVTFTLPLSPTFGDTFIIASTTSRFQISANGGQKMLIGTITSTAGSGTATSNSAGDYVEFVYMGSNTFQCFSPQGTITLT